MIKFMFNIIIIIFVVFITELFAYNYIRKIDKKEREKLQKWELDHLKKIKENELVK